MAFHVPATCAASQETSSDILAHLDSLWRDDRKSEALESILSILVGVNVNDPSVSQWLKALHQNAGFTQYVELGDAKAATLAKLADFISRSISAQSQALGTGGPSQSLSF